MRQRASFHRHLVAGLSVAALAGSSRAADDDVAALALSICAAPDVAKMSELLANRGADDAMPEEQVAEAFGIASYMTNLARCASPQAITEGYALFKSDKDQNQLDAAFAVGHVSARPDDANAKTYKGSFEVLAGAGEPASNQ